MIKNKYMLKETLKEIKSTFQNNINIKIYILIK